MGVCGDGFECLSLSFLSPREDGYGRVTVLTSFRDRDEQEELMCLLEMDGTDGFVCREAVCCGFLDRDLKSAFD